MIRLAIVGLGGMGKNHARVATGLPECEVVAAQDISAEARAAFAEAHPDAVLYEDYDKLLADERVDALVIALPTGLHKETVVRALESGRHVMVEKPMARSVAECRAMNEAAAKAGKVLMVAQCRRFDVHWGAWREVVTSGRIGRPILWRDIRAGKGPGRWFMDDALGGGPLLDGAVHNYDFANWMFGDPVSVVSSTVKLVPGVTAQDTGSTVVRYPSGDQLLLSWSWGARGLHLFDVVGPQGFIQQGAAGIAPPAEDGDAYNYWCVTNADNEKELVKAPKEPAMLVTQMKHFADCAANGAACESPGTEAIKAVAVAEAILTAGPNGEARKVEW